MPRYEEFDEIDRLNMLDTDEVNLTDVGEDGQVYIFLGHERITGRKIVWTISGRTFSDARGTVVGQAKNLYPAGDWEIGDAGFWFDDELKSSPKIELPTPAAPLDPKDAPF